MATAAVLLGCADVSWAQCEVNETMKIVASDGQEDDRFGRAISIDGDLALVGALDSAYVLRYDGSTWTEEQKLLAWDGASTIYFGFAAAISGDTAVIGACFDDVSGENSGSAYVFRFDGSTWVGEVKLVAGDGAAGDKFGRAVAIDGDIIVVGSYADDDNGTDSGSAYVFNFDGTTWSEQAKLLASNGAAEDSLGYHVAVSGDAIILGAPAETGVEVPGAAYVYRFDGFEWIEEALLQPSDPFDRGRFGYSVAIAGALALVGAPWNEGNVFKSGAAYVYRFSRSGWTEEAELFAWDGIIYDNFGVSVGITDHVAAVGARGDDDLGSHAGSAFFYRFDGATWDEDLKLLASDGAASDALGEALAIGGDSALVGAADNNDDRGAVYALANLDVIFDECEPSPGEYTVTEIPTLGGEYNYALAVNELGQVVGYSEVTNNIYHAYLWEDGVLTDLGALPGYSCSYATDINVDGQIVGYSTMDNYETSPRATLWDGGQIIDLGALGGSDSKALAIDDDGVIVGWASTPSVWQHAFKYENGQMVDIGATWPDKPSAATGINSAGAVTGHVMVQFELLPFCGQKDSFIYTNGTPNLVCQPPGDQWCLAADINAQNQIVGTMRYWWHMYCAGSYPFAWSYDPANGWVQMLSTPLPAQLFSWAYALNDHGEIVGAAWSGSDSSLRAALLWRDYVVHDLNDLVPAGSGSALRDAYDINNQGQIVAYRGHRAVLLTPIITGDVNGDGVVNVLDLLAVLGAWGPCVGCPEDINGDGVVDVLDLLEVLANWS